MNTKTPPAAVRQAQSGFTLIEIMVVIVILGLLATIVVPNLVGASDEAKLTKAKTDIAMIAGQVKMFLIKKGKLPDNLEELAQKDDKGGGALLDTLPKDPWDHDYQIIPGSNRNDWEVVSYGPDGVQSEDDISSKAPTDK